VAAAGRILSEQDLNRALLARQLLLERVKSPIPKVLDRMGTLQAQYAPSMYIGLWSRAEGFGREQLDSALERRAVAQGTLMRATIHLTSAADYWPIALGVRRGRREAWLSASYRSDYKAAQMSAAARKLRSRLGDGTMSRKEIHELLGSDSVITNGVNMWLDLVRVPPSGTWERRRADLYASAEAWLGPPPKRLDEAGGIELLVRRYLGGYGPATADELANWAGLHPKRVGPALEAMKLRRHEAEDGAELLDLPRAAMPDPETPAPVRFLPTWDATLLVHARRTGILPEEHRSKVFNTRTPQSVPTFLVDGRVAGTWSFDKGKIKTSLFGRLGAAAKRELREEADRLAELHMD
jgi:Winged helix DNA-binding domain